MGKIYDRMFMILDGTEKSTVPWKDKAAEKIKERWEYVHSPMHAAGYALDPEFMMNTKEWDEAVTEGTLKIIERMCIRDYICSASYADLSQEVINGDYSLLASNPKVNERVADAERELSVYRERDGIFTRPSVILNAKQMAPSEWWGLYGKHLPILSGVATKVLSQTVCASAAERNWSVYGAIKTAARGTMGHAVADKRVYCHEALHLKGKLQAAGSKQVVEKWDTDSDSDNYDDEDLKM